MNRQNKTLYSYYLSSLMRGRIPAWSVDEGTADTMEQELLLEQYVVLVIMTDFSADFLSSHPEILESAYAAFSETQFLEQLSANLGNRYLVSSTQVNDLTACVVSISADSKDVWQNELRDALMPITEHFEREYHCKNYYSCSSIHHGITELSASYTEAADLMSFAVMNSDSGDILFPEDILLMNPQDSIPSPNLEQTITNYVLTAQSQELSLFITDTLNQYASESLSFHTMKGLACGIVFIILRGLEQLPQRKNAKEQEKDFYHILSSIVKETSYDRLKGRLLEAASKACELSASSCLSQRKNPLVERIEAELSQNLYNENLNIMFLSEQLGLNAKYLSAAYQEATGNNLINVIHQRRIKRFKELLAEDDYSIKEAAQRVGYTNVVTLNRWFKKFEGVTPGKIKALAEHPQHNQK